VLRGAYFAAGLIALLFGAVGAFVPLLPTVPFLILAAYCFGRSSPALEQRLLDHPAFGPHIMAWRTRGAISRRGKATALATFVLSAILGLLLLDWPMVMLPIAIALIGGTWITTRPNS